MVHELVHQVKEKRQGFVARGTNARAFDCPPEAVFSLIFLNLNVMKLKASVSITAVMLVAGMWRGEGFHTAESNIFIFKELD